MRVKNEPSWSLQEKELKGSEQGELLLRFIDSWGSTADHLMDQGVEDIEAVRQGLAIVCAEEIPATPDGLAIASYLLLVHWEGFSDPVAFDAKLTTFERVIITLGADMAIRQAEEAAAEA